MIKQKIYKIINNQKFIYKKLRPIEFFLLNRSLNLTSNFILYIHILLVDNSEFFLYFL